MMRSPSEAPCKERKWQLKNPAKRRAHITLGNAVRDRKVAKPEACSECGSGGRIEGHHPNYALPLVVEWLCSACHRAKHTG